MSTTVDTFYDIRYTVTDTPAVRHFDVLRVIPYSNIPVKNITLSLNSKTLSDAFSAGTVRQLVPDMKLGDSIIGNILDYRYNFVAEALSQTGGHLDITGRYSSDKLLYSLIDYDLDASDRLGYHNGRAIYPVYAYFKKIAKALGLTPRFYCKNFPVRFGTVNRQCTYQQALQGLFGWCDLQHVDINVFIRGSNLFCVQRGRESDVIADDLGQNVVLTDTANVRSEPTFNTVKLRTEWQGTVSSGPIKSSDIVDDDPEPFSGSIAFGDNSLSYIDGYLVQETTEVVAGTSNITKYTYTEIDGKKYLAKKEYFDVVMTACSKTEYEYADNNGVLYLATETEYANGSFVSMDTPDYSNADITVTTHAPLLNGWYGTTTRNVSTGEVSTSLGQGSPANAVSQYTIDRANEAMDSFRSTWADLRNRILASLLGTPIINTNYPIDTYWGRSDIRWFAEQTDWLNNKTEETVTMDVVNVDHVLDFTDIISYRGKNYVLQSNNVTLTPNGINQNLTLVRWY